MICQCGHGHVHHVFKGHAEWIPPEKEFGKCMICPCKNFKEKEEIMKLSEEKIYKLMDLVFKGEGLDKSNCDIAENCDPAILLTIDFRLQISDRSMFAHQIMHMLIETMRVTHKQ